MNYCFDGMVRLGRIVRNNPYKLILCYLLCMCFGWALLSCGCSRDGEDKSCRENAMYKVSELIPNAYFITNATESSFIPNVRFGHQGNNATVCSMKLSETFSNTSLALNYVETLFAENKKYYVYQMKKHESTCIEKGNLVELYTIIAYGIILTGSLIQIMVAWIAIGYRCYANRQQIAAQNEMQQIATEETEAVEIEKALEGGIDVVDSEDVVLMEL